jgi:hypothetical protein
MKGGSLSSARAKIWDKKMKDFIDFAAKMRKKPGLVGSPIYVPTTVSGPRKEPEVIKIPDTASPRHAHSKPKIARKEADGPTKTGNRILNVWTQTATNQKPTQSQNAHRGHTQQKHLYHLLACDRPLMRIATMTYGLKLQKYNASKIAQIAEGAARYTIPGMYAQQSKKDATTTYRLSSAINVSALFG